MSHKKKSNRDNHSQSPRGTRDNRMLDRRGALFELRPLGSHVAVRDGPYPVRLTHCLAGVDYGHEDHQVRGQYLQLPRRRCFSGCCGRFATNGVASLPGLIRRRVWGGALAMVFELGLTHNGYAESWSYGLCELAGQGLFRGGRGGPAAVFMWHALELRVEQSAQSASGVLHLMPLRSAALCGKQHRSGGRGEAQLREALEHASVSFVLNGSSSIFGSLSSIFGRGLHRTA